MRPSTKRTHSDWTNVELSWARVLSETYPFFIEFPTDPTELTRIVRSKSYRASNYYHIASFKCAVEYQDLRFQQQRKCRLVLGVSEVIQWILKNVYLNTILEWNKVYDRKILRFTLVSWQISWNRWHSWINLCKLWPTRNSRVCWCLLQPSTVWRKTSNKEPQKNFIRMRFTSTGFNCFKVIKINIVDIIQYANMKTKYIQIVRGIELMELVSSPSCSWS